MREKPVRKRFSTRVCWGVTGTHKLDSLQFYPGLVRCAIESAMFYHL